ncbi:EndoU domain-containing protein, partial [Actinomadura adrarensis]
GGGAGIFEPAIRWMRGKVNSSGRHHHVFRGEVRQRTRNGQTQWVGSGYHHRFMGQDWADRRITSVVRRGSNGTYAARVQMKGPNGQWVDKPADSSFFPDNWTPQQVDRTIRDAFDNRTDVPGTDGRRWRGFADGILVEGSYKRSSRNWDSAWPIVD